MDRAAAEGRPPALSSEKVEAVRDFLENGGSVSAAARTFGVSRPTVRAVRDGTYRASTTRLDVVRCTFWGTAPCGTHGQSQKGPSLGFGCSLG